ncbi:MAG: tRNA lysidine(34) synthetase TilS, partial [Chloroflexi bacterium]
MGSHSAFLAPDGRFETLTNARLASDVRNPRVLVAVSGGPDSTALLLALREAGRDIVAAHYDHALRDGSDAVARQVAELCARIGVPLITERLALAHTADDVVEGSVLHLLRGCGLAGLRGMPERRGHFVRPMLGVWKSEVREFLRQRHVVPHEDPANLDTRFARVRVRREILPALER